MIAYQASWSPIPQRSPAWSRIDQMGLKEGDLSKLPGSRQRRSDLLSGRRKLSLSLIRSLHQHLRIPAETLIRETAGDGAPNCKDYVRAGNKGL